MVKKHKILIIVLSSVLIFAVVISSCITDTYSYYFDAMKVKRVFCENTENFENIVEYLVSKNLKKGQKIVLDSSYADSKISYDIASICSPYIEYKYYDDSGYVMDEQDIRFYYSYSPNGLYLNYSSNGIAGDYEWRNKKLNDKWYLHYETPFMNKRG